MIKYTFVKTHFYLSLLFLLISREDHVLFHVSLNKRDHLSLSDQQVRRVIWMIDSLSTVSGSLIDRKSTRLNSSHVASSYAVFCLKKKKKNATLYTQP